MAAAEVGVQFDSKRIVELLNSFGCAITPKEINKPTVSMLYLNIFHSINILIILISLNALLEFTRFLLKLVLVSIMLHMKWIHLAQ